MLWSGIIRRRIGYFRMNQEILYAGKLFLKGWKSTFLRWWDVIEGGSMDGMLSTKQSWRMVLSGIASGWKLSAKTMYKRRLNSHAKPIRKRNSITMSTIMSLALKPKESSGWSKICRIVVSGWMVSAFRGTGFWNIRKWICSIVMLKN